MVKKKIEDEWSAFNDGSTPEIEPTPEEERTAVEELAVPSIIRLDTAPGDHRTNFKLGPTCLSCKYFWYANASVRGFCHYPDITPKIKMGEERKVGGKLIETARARGWKRSSPIFVCDHWTRIQINRITTHLAWINLDNSQVWEKEE
jgi:hypothetical protein